MSLRAVLRFARDDRGISALEYALLLSFLGTAIAAAALALGNAVNGSIDEMTDTINDN
jgi:Flp pilus assembly pilin Flp